MGENLLLTPFLLISICDGVASLPNYRRPEKFPDLHSKNRKICWRNLIISFSSCLEISISRSLSQTHIFRTITKIKSPQKSRNILHLCELDTHSAKQKTAE